MHRERNKIWFKISSNGDRRSNTYMQAPFKKKTLNIAISILFFCKLLRNEGLSQKWAYFTLKLGWLKTNAGTNRRPQNNMYLSAPEYPVWLSHSHQKLSLITQTTKVRNFTANFNRSTTGFPCFLEILEIEKNQIISL